MQYHCKITDFFSIYRHVRTFIVKNSANFVPCANMRIFAAQSPPGIRTAGPARGVAYNILKKPLQ